MRILSSPLLLGTAVATLVVSAVAQTITGTEPTSGGGNNDSNNNNGENPLSNLFVEDAGADENGTTIFVEDTEAGSDAEAPSSNTAVATSYPSLLSLFPEPLICQGHKIRGPVPVDGVTRGTGAGTTSSVEDTDDGWLDSAQAMEVAKVCGGVDHAHPANDRYNDGYNYYFDVEGAAEFQAGGEYPFSFYSFQGTGELVDVSVCILLTSGLLAPGDVPSSFHQGGNRVMVVKLEADEAFCDDPDYFWWNCQDHSSEKQPSDPCSVLSVETELDATYVVVIYKTKDLDTSFSSYTFGLTLSSRALGCDTAEDAKISVNGTTVTTLGTASNEGVSTQWATFQGTGGAVTISGCNEQTRAPKDAPFPFLSVYRGSCQEGYLKPIVEVDRTLQLPYSPSSYSGYGDDNVVDVDTVCALIVPLPTEEGVTYYVKVPDDRRAYALSFHETPLGCTEPTALTYETALQLSLSEDPDSDSVLADKQAFMCTNNHINDRSRQPFLGPLEFFSFNVTSRDSSQNVAKLIACAEDDTQQVQINVYTDSCDQERNTLECIFPNVYSYNGGRCQTVDLSGMEADMSYHASVALLDSSISSNWGGKNGALVIGVYQNGPSLIEQECQQAKPLELNAPPTKGLFDNSTDLQILPQGCRLEYDFDLGTIQWHSFVGNGKNVTMYALSSGRFSPNDIRVMVFGGYCPGALRDDQGEGCESFQIDSFKKIPTAVGTVYNIAVISRTRDITDFEIGIYEDLDCPVAKGTPELEVGSTVHIDDTIPGFWTIPFDNSFCQHVSLRNSLGWTSFLKLKVPKDQSFRISVEDDLDVYWGEQRNFAVKDKTCGSGRSSLSFNSAEDRTVCVIVQRSYDKSIDPENWNTAQMLPFKVKVDRVESDSSSNSSVGIDWKVVTAIVAALVAMSIIACLACYADRRRRHRQYPTDGTSNDENMTIEFIDEDVSGDPVTATATKPTVDTSVGLVLTRKNGGVVITRIKDNSIFVESDLRVGMRVVSVNDTSCWSSSSTEEVVALLSSSKGEVTIVACNPNMAC